MNPENENAPHIAIEQRLKSTLEAGNLVIPILPKVANEVLQMSQNPDIDMSDLSKLIHQDQTIAGSVLRIANSAAFAGAERIVSLQQAVTRLGMQLLTEIAMSVAIRANIFNSPKYKHEIQSLWQHALASAVFGKEIAKFIRINVEGQYICGLLHSIGKPVLIKTIEGLEIESNVSIENSEVMKIVEDYHLVVGEFVTAKWNLPKSVQVANKYYQNYLEAPEFKTETAITYLADRLATLLVEEEPQPDRELKFDPVFETLNIYPQDRVNIFEQMDHVKTVVSSMSI